MTEVNIPRKIFDRMIAHCRSGFPDEACGLLAGKAVVVEELYEAENINPSPFSYEMNPRDQIQAQRDMREKGLSLIAIYHSHPCSGVYPSQIDKERALWEGRPLFEDVAYVIVSFAGAETECRAFSIGDGGVAEMGFRICPDS